MNEEELNLDIDEETLIKFIKLEIININNLSTFKDLSSKHIIKCPYDIDLSESIINTLYQSSEKILVFFVQKGEKKNC